jgi:hypothetical protein
MPIVAEDTTLIKFYEARIRTHSTYQNRVVWLHDDLEMLKAIKNCIDLVTFDYLKGVIKKALDTA